MPSPSRTPCFVHTNLVGVCLAATCPVAAPAAEPGQAGIEARAEARVMADRDRSTAAACAAEKGWFGLARHLWQKSDEQAAAKDTGGTAPLPTARGFAEQIARLDAAEQDRLRWTAARAAAAGERWSAALYKPRWQVQSADKVHPAPLTIAAGLVLWNSGREVHAVTIATGRPAWQPAWQPTANARDTLLFPRGVASGQTPAAQKAGQTPPGQAFTVPLAALATVRNRAYAMLERNGGSLLVCLDLSAGAEGRLAWVAEAQGLAEAEGLEPFAGRASSAATLIFDGQPTADHELCLIVARRDTPQSELLLAAFDARDGSLQWLRPVGSALARDGVNYARGHRQAGFAEDRILLATHAGSIQAFDRDGTPAWRTEVPSAADDPGPASAAIPPAAPPRLVRDRVLVLPQDSRGVVALEARSGAIAWQWMPEGDCAVAQLFAVAGEGLVVATRSRTGTAGLVRLAYGDGQPTAEYSGVAGLCKAAGASILADQTIFWPVRPVPSGPQAATEMHAPTASAFVEILDATTLRPRRPPVECLPGDDIQDDVQLAAGQGYLVIATPGVTTCLQATPPQSP